MILRKALLTGGIVFAYLFPLVCSRISDEADLRDKGDLAYIGATQSRKVYRFSVVPGGVYSGAELAAVRRIDPVVAEHYSDFGSSAVVTRLKEDMFVYISYRSGNKVYWSRKKHKVCKGETVLTDGKNLARTRCGNRLSRVFKMPVLPPRLEPTEQALSLPQPPPEPFEGLPGGGPLLTENLPLVPPFTDDQSTRARSGAAPAPGGSTGNEPRVQTAANAGLQDPLVMTPQMLAMSGFGPTLLAAAVPPGGGGGGSSPAGGGGSTPTVPVTIPEPASWLLLAVGLAFARKISFTKARD